MGRLALVGSHGFLALTPWAGARQVELRTERGPVIALDAGDHVVPGLDAAWRQRLGDGRAIAAQLGLSYAAVCVVDNLANGVGESPLTPEEFEAGQAANRERLATNLAALVPLLVGEDG